MRSLRLYDGRDARLVFQTHNATRYEVLMSFPAITGEIPPSFTVCLSERSHEVGYTLEAVKERR